MHQNANQPPEVPEPQHPSEVPEAHTTSRVGASSDAAALPARPRRRRVILAVGVLAMVLATGAAVVYWRVTSSAYLIGHVAPMLEDRFGGPVTIDNARVSGTSLQLRGVELRAPGVPGPAGVVARIDHATLQFDRSPMIADPEHLQGITIDGAMVRLAERADDPGRFNVAALTPIDIERGDRPPPPVELRSMRVQYGEYGVDGWRLRGERRVVGAMQRRGDDSPWIDFTLRDTPENSDDVDRLHIEGRWHTETLDAYWRIDGLHLNERAYVMCPQHVRMWWDQMDLDGRVEHVSVRTQRGRLIDMEMRLANAAMTLPVEAPEFWVRFDGEGIEPAVGRPRLYVDSGTIRLDPTHLRLIDLEGRLASTEGEAAGAAPFSMTMAVDALSEPIFPDARRWLRRTLQRAAFEMTLEIDSYARRDAGDDAPGQAVELPVQLARAMENLGLETWEVTSRVNVFRDRPRGDEPGRLRVDGEATIRNARGAFPHFAYPLDDVSADLSFTDESVTLHALSATGSGSSRIDISGEILASEQPGVRLDIRARRLPVDEVLRRSLSGGLRGVYDMLVDREAAAAYRDADLWIDDEAVQRARERRLAVLDRISELTAMSEAAPLDPREDDERRRLRRELARLDRLVETGPFDVTGLVDVEMEIRRPPDSDARPTSTGRVVVHHGTVVCRNFAYPIRVTSGIVDWTDERVVLREDTPDGGVAFVTPGGGRGVFTGTVAYPRVEDGRDVKPELHVRVEDDVLNDLLLAAIPGEARDSSDDASETGGEDAIGTAGADVPWSAPAELLDRIELDGALTYEGGIFLDDESGRTVYDFLAELDDGSARLGPHLRDVIGEDDLPWPGGFDLDGLAGRWRITPASIEIEELTGRRGDQRVRTTGRINVTERPVTARFELEVKELLLERDLLELTGPAKAMLDELWGRYEPDGAFDAGLDIDMRGEAMALRSVRLTPREVQLRVQGRPIVIRPRSGSLTLTDGEVRFGGLALSLHTPAQSAGVLTLDGGWTPGRDGGLWDLNARWADGRFEAPLVEEILDLAEQSAVARVMDDLTLRGTFSADLTYRSPRDGEARRLELILEPHTARVSRQQGAFRATFEPSSRLKLTPGRIDVEQLSGTSDDATWSAIGSVDLSDQPAAQVRISAESPSGWAALQPLLPDAAHDALDRIDFDARGRVGFDDVMLQLDRVDGPDGPGWRSRLRGPIDVADASLELGLPLTEMDGRLEIDLDAQPGRALELNIDSAIERLRVSDRRLTDVRASVSLDELGETVQLNRFRADAYGGAVNGRAEVELEGDRAYTARIDLIGIELRPFLADGRDDDEQSREPPRMNGRLYGRVQLSGRGGDADRRVGRGRARIIDGRLVRMPIALRLLQVAHLMPPLSGSFETADLSFYLEGDTVIFERLTLQSPMLELRGDGEMNFESMNLDLRFRTRGRVAGLSEFVGRISDRLYVLEVSGPVGDPGVRLTPLPGIGRSDQRSVGPPPPPGGYADQPR